MLGAYRRAIDRAVSSFMGEVVDRDLTGHLDGPSDDAWLGEKLFTALAQCSNKRISKFHAHCYRTTSRNLPQQEASPQSVRSASTEVVGQAARYAAGAAIRTNV
jgi:hypothetical protein